MKTTVRATEVLGKNADLYRVRLLDSNDRHQFEYVVARSFSDAARVAKSLARGRVVLTFGRWSRASQSFTGDGFDDVMHDEKDRKIDEALDLIRETFDNTAALVTKGELIRTLALVEAALREAKGEG